MECGGNGTAWNALLGVAGIETAFTIKCFNLIKKHNDVDKNNTTS